VRRKSRKRQHVEELAAPAREAYRHEHYLCQFPRCRRLADDLHELARGPARASSLGIAASLLALCRRHHEWLHRHPQVVYGLAVKWLAQDGTYDRVAVARLRGRKDDSITQREVEAVAELIQSGELRLEI